MHFALVNNEQTEAQPKLKGLCPCCGHGVTAKCGKYRIWHWAHDPGKECDKWHEPETEWHRAWKNKFPREWQEKIHYDQSGEKHIADVRTIHGLFIEFQRSPIEPQERDSRERFYRNMIWVVDGTRRKSDFQRFARTPLIPTPRQLWFLVALPNKFFPLPWLDSTAPVIFDFSGTEPSQPVEPKRDMLWCLLPGRAEGHAVVAAMPRDFLVKIAADHAQLFQDPPHAIVSALAHWIRTPQREAQNNALRRYQQRRLAYQQRGRPRRF